MVRKVLTGFKRFVLWDYARATWQYDVMVGLILCFLFLTPREWFRDQPRVPQANPVAALQGAHGTNVYWIDAEMLSNTPEAARARKAAEILRQRTGTRQDIVRLEQILDSESELKGYMAFTRP